MKPLNPTLVALAVSVLFVGCSSESHRDHAASSTTNTATEVATLPADLFSDTSLPNLSTLIDVKESAKAGDEVTFVAAIGGRANPFIDGRAVMVVSDLSLPFCTDGCAIPWDACCETPANIVKSTATVQIVDESGNPLRVGLKGPLKAGSEIQISGVVHQADEGAYVVNARRMHVAP